MTILMYFSFLMTLIASRLGQQLDVSTVLTSATAIGFGCLGLVQAATNAVKMARPDISSSVLMFTAFAAGLLFVNIIALAAGAPFNVQSVALHSLAGFLSGAGAMGLHEMGSQASNKRYTALYAANFDHSEHDADAAG